VTLQRPEAHPTIDALGGVPPAVHEFMHRPQFSGSEIELLSQYGWVMSQCCHGLGQLAPTGTHTPPLPQLKSVGTPRGGVLPFAADAQLSHPEGVHPYSGSLSSTHFFTWVLTSGHAFWPVGHPASYGSSPTASSHAAAASAMAAPRA
jgi:hypothetical protein